MKNPFKLSDATTLVTAKNLRRRNFIAFTGFLGLNALGYMAWRWLYKSPDEMAGVTAGARRPLRKALNQNELIFRNTFSNNHLVPTYPTSKAARNVRVNSHIGMTNAALDRAAYRLEVKKKDGSSLHISLDELRSLPKTEIVFDFKCVEGWDQISWWGGVRFSDFVRHYGLEAETAMKYVGMATASRGYYVGIEMPGAMHPQTILAYEVNNQLLPPDHGQPLRLIIPVKYGIKNIKQIATISFSDSRPPDYWAEEGYDYYSGL